MSCTIAGWVSRDQRTPRCGNKHDESEKSKRVWDDRPCSPTSHRLVEIVNESWDNNRHEEKKKDFLERGDPADFEMHSIE